MDISRPHSPVRSRLATTTSISCHAVFSIQNNKTNRLFGGLEVSKDAHHNEAKPGLPNILAGTLSSPQNMTQSLAQRDANTNQELKSLFSLEATLTPQQPSDQTSFRNLGELALIYALIDDLSARLIHYRKIENEHFQPGLYHSEICDARRKTCKMKNRNTCSWKLVLICPFRKNIPPPATQEIPDLRVTNHHGNVYSLEEVLPELDAQEFKEHVQKRENWGKLMEEYIDGRYGRDPAWCHEREMHFRLWSEEIEGRGEEETPNGKVEFKQVKRFIPMDPILEEPEDDETDEDVTSENESSNDSTLGGHITTNETLVNDTPSRKPSENRP